VVQLEGRGDRVIAKVGGRLRWSAAASWFLMMFL
jgi:hypothetical protein